MLPHRAPIPTKNAMSITLLPIVVTIKGAYDNGYKNGVGKIQLLCKKNVKIGGSAKQGLNGLAFAIYSGAFCAGIHWFKALFYT